MKKKRKCGQNRREKKTEEPFPVWILFLVMTLGYLVKGIYFHINETVGVKINYYFQVEVMSALSSYFLFIIFFIITYFSYKNRNKIFDSTWIEG